jgi:hypothetical protein
MGVAQQTRFLPAFPDRVRHSGDLVVSRADDQDRTALGSLGSTPRFCNGGGAIIPADFSNGADGIQR